MEPVVKRFIKYAKQHTTSDPDSESYPSTDRQLDFMRNLAEELKKTGLSDVQMEEFGYVTATIEANGKTDSPVVGFIAHVDTSPDFSGENVNPIVRANYDGAALELGNGVTIDPKEFPEILKYVGQDIITADGTTLLGADDKAGIAEIVTAAEIILNSKDIQHGKIRLAFTPDEEIGKGTDHFDVKGFGADFAYTVDGGEIGELEFENFNAAGAKIKITGRSVHPGTAKNKMINASLIATKLISMLPPMQRPENTEDYEGFYHLISLRSTVSSAEMEFIIRDHSFEKFDEKKKLLEDTVKRINLEYGKEIVDLEITDQYYNMLEKIEPVMYIVDLAKEAMTAAGVKPIIKPIRGGTDGARLSYEGLPCPNLFTGGHYYHGPYEFIPIASMVKSVEVILNIVRLVGR